MAYKSDVSSNILPVFVLEKWVQEATVFDMCLASEKVSGPATIDGATCIAGLWRVYPKTELARIKLLTSGVCFKGKNVRFESFNPFIRKGDGTEGQGTRLTISNLPFSYSNDAVSRNLIAAGFKLRSNIQFEKARGPDGKLTDWKTGRRFVWIDLPKGEVKRSLNMGSFTAYIFFREMRDKMQCRRCLQTGHKAVDCPNDEVCLTCKKSGHRRGDPICNIELNDDIPVSESENESRKSDEEDDELSEASSQVSDQEEGEVSDEEVLKDEEKNAEVSGERTERTSLEDLGKEDDSEVPITKAESHQRGKASSTGAANEVKKDKAGTGNSSSKIGYLSKDSRKQYKKNKSTGIPKINPIGSKAQSSIDSFVCKDGKRPVDDILSPSDGKSGSPDQRRAKIDN